MSFLRTLSVQAEPVSETEPSTEYTRRKPKKKDEEASVKPDRKTVPWLPGVLIAIGIFIFGKRRHL